MTDYEAAIEQFSLWFAEHRAACEKLNLLKMVNTMQQARWWQSRAIAFASR